MSSLLAGPALLARARRALAVPLAAALGAELLDDDDPAGGARCVVAGIADNGGGSAHAAALAALLELAGYLALAPTLATDEHAVTHAVALQLIGAAPVGATVEARGALDRRTRRTAFVTAAATVDGAVVARAQLTKTVVPFGGR
jgi:acyl-coenzyme A thioesterase PaaI-like protein